MVTESDKIVDFIKKSGGTVAAEEVVIAGWSYHFLKKLVDQGVLWKPERGMYNICEGKASNYKEALHAVPQGVLCLYSSAYIHRLIKKAPDAIHMAIPYKSKVEHPTYPAIKVYDWFDKRYQLGLEKRTIDGVEVKLCNVEKTVCDFLKYRKAIGVDYAMSIFKTYKKRKKVDMDTIIAYSKEMNFYKSFLSKEV